MKCDELTIPLAKVLYCSVQYRTERMPKPGFKSITVSENVYNKFFDIYEKSKKNLELKGITSFSGYLTSLMQEAMIKYEAFAKHAPFIHKIAVEENRIILKDNKSDRIVEVALRDQELQCLLDRKSDCVHVGFVYSLPETYSMISSKGIKIPRGVQ
jgi:hypothetical protein